MVLSGGNIDANLLARVIYAHQPRVSIGTCIRDLELVATAGEPEDLRDRVLLLTL